MIVLEGERARELRKKYICSFIDINSEYFVNHILTMKAYCDGMCYDGYLWDCLANPKVISKECAHQIIHSMEDFYVMWDIHSCEKIFVPNYWKYPKTSILFVENWADLLELTLPEDIYLFDDSFTRSVIFTHETDDEDNPYCIECSR